MLGPVFLREASTAPRRPRHFVLRTVYVVALLVVMCTAWLLHTGTQIVRDVGDMARFGAALFQILAPLQLAVITFLAALMAASGVSQEKDRRTLILLLMTRISNTELVLGKLFSGLLGVLVMLASALPLFLAVTLFGGVSTEQVGRVYAVTLATALAAGSVGCTVAFWREKTFQTLAITSLALLLWAGLGEVAQIALGTGATGFDVGVAVSPVRAVVAAARAGASPLAVWLNVAVAGGLAALLNLLAIGLVRVWNPSREARPRQEEEDSATIWSAAKAEEAEALGAKGALGTTGKAEQSREGHVDARVRAPSRRSRPVWDNPILWRETRTRAYGRKIVLVRLAYLLLFGLAAAAVLREPPPSHHSSVAQLPDAARPLAPFFLVSLVIINSLAVTSITNERDGQALDLLLVTDLSPREFVFGKLLGVFWVTKEMVLLPAALCVMLYVRGAMSGESLTMLLGGLLVMDIFVATLGVHCGMHYSRSRSAIGVSLGTVFFLFLGVVTCLLVMISFSGSFSIQLAPFLAFILGGAVGLFATLGVRNPSAAIGWASVLLPFCTFYAITNFLMGRPMSVFLFTVGIYGFTTAAMLVPALSEFDIAMGRTKAGAEE